ncbi:MAG: HAD family hydrolase [Desulfuromonadales bacterium]|nr:HAD family hydrolase [Desulfuromonadales bacterium]NIR34420.1 HAD family hydrolase [Desulfuromonadales bacterium]NIS44428.1 HAD family hydrolase [Desulfuromonadales bacterium]
MLTSLDATSSIVFDLDGTLYTEQKIADQIMAAAGQLVAESRGVSREKGGDLIRQARQRLAETYDEDPPLTLTCMELGIDVRDFHQALQGNVTPERFLSHDPALCALLDSLRDHCDLYIYTNNSLPMAKKILALLGVEEMFSRLYTIEFTWLPKPDPDALQRVLEDIGGPPESFLFVGDRQEVDLDPPEALGISTLLISETGDLLQIHKLLGIIP